MECECSNAIIFSVVKKEGPNQGRSFFKCNGTSSKSCNKFYWGDSKNYDSYKFKGGSCRRCGRYGCDATSCTKVFDWYGNLIPDEW